MTFTPVTLTERYELADGVPAAGTVRLTPTAPMDNDGTVVAASVSRTLDAEGDLTIEVKANTDPDTSPQHVWYRVDERISGVREAYYVQVPHDQGSTIDLSSLERLTTLPHVPATPVSMSGVTGLVNALAEKVGPVSGTAAVGKILAVDTTTPLTFELIDAPTGGGEPEVVPAVIREVLHDFERDNSVATVDFTTGSGTKAGDTIVVVHGADWNHSDLMLAPTGDISSWELEAFAGDGNNIPHLKVWSAQAPTDGPVDISINRLATNSEAYFGTVIVYQGSAAIEGAQVATGTGTAQAAPSLTPAGPARMLLSVWQAGYNGSADQTYTGAPDGMTLRSLDAAGSLSGGTGAMLVATEELDDATPTGTRTATFGESRAWAAVSLLVGPGDPLLAALSTVPSLEELEQSVRLGDVDFTGTLALGVAQTDQRIGSLALAMWDEIPADDSNYWTVSLVRYRAGTPATLANRLTDDNAPYGTAVEPWEAWTFDLVTWTDANRYLRKGDVLALDFTKTGTPDPWHGLTVTWRYEPGVTS